MLFYGANFKYETSPHPGTEGDMLGIIEFLKYDGGIGKWYYLMRIKKEAYDAPFA
ncbi:hypothetical protein GCM10008983_00820 [Lentibacillus halophilus]|uniref:Uncharacterized protein n=1 Tax=Lentibacillus halophilus TaxID=295065 RepID=A0ABP3IV82_9BACI